MRQRIAAVLEKSIVIAKSDLIILVVSSTLLGVAVYRWDQNTRNVDTSTVLANTRLEAAATAVETSIDTNVLVSSTAANAEGTNSLPVDETSSLPTTIESAPAADAEPTQPFLIHVVRSGDSLSEIAARYDTSVNELRDANGISGSTIFIGQEILYPAK